MRGFALYGSLLVVAHIGAVAWHLSVISHTHPGMSVQQVALFTAATSVVPVSALVLLWTRFQRLGALLLLFALSVGLGIGGYEHFLSAGSDNVFRMAPGEWTTPFQVSAALLLLLETAGCWIAIRILTSQRTKQFPASNAHSASEAKD
jgi:hypothetical protein